MQLVRFVKRTGHHRILMQRIDILSNHGDVEISHRQVVMRRLELSHVVRARGQSKAMRPPAPCPCLAPPLTSSPRGVEQRTACRACPCGD